MPPKGDVDPFNRNYSMKLLRTPISGLFSSEKSLGVIVSSLVDGIREKGYITSMLSTVRQLDKLG